MAGRLPRRKGAGGAGQPLAEHEQRVLRWPRRSVPGWWEAAEGAGLVQPGEKEVEVRPFHSTTERRM